LIDYDSVQDFVHMQTNHTKTFIHDEKLYVVYLHTIDDVFELIYNLFTPCYYFLSQ